MRRKCGRRSDTITHGVKPPINGDSAVITREEKEKMVVEAAFPEPSADNGVTARKMAPHTARSTRR